MIGETVPNMMIRTYNTQQQTTPTNMEGSRDTLDEEPVKFDTSHYKNGLNGDFSEGDVASVMQKYGNKQGGKFEDPELREIAKHLDDIVALIKSSLAPSPSGSLPVVCDVGAGTGLFLSPLSRMSSTLYAADISPHFRAGLQQRCDDEGLSNVQVVASTARDLPLPPGSVDCVIMVDVYHHLEFPLTTCRQIRRSLKKNGRFVVLDFYRDEAIYERTKTHEPGWVTAHVRMTQDEARREILSCGFRMVSEPVIDELVENYIFVLEPLDDEELSRGGPGKGWATEC